MPEESGSNTGQGVEFTTIYQVVFLLSTTCVTQEITEHGGGTCFPNLAAATWSIQRVVLPYYNSQGLGQQFYKLDVDAPGISVRAIIALFIIALLMSATILLSALLSCCLGTSVRLAKKQRKYAGKARWWRLAISILGFICMLSGAILLRVQVSATVSSHIYGISQDYSSRFWGVVWASVGLTGVNSLVLAVDAFGNSQREKAIARGI